MAIVEVCDGLFFVDEARIARSDEQLGEARQLRDDVESGRATLKRSLILLI
jgi:hypothetical protein